MGHQLVDDIPVGLITEFAIDRTDEDRDVILTLDNPLPVDYYGEAMIYATVVTCPQWGDGLEVGEIVPFALSHFPIAIAQPNQANQTHQLKMTFEIAF